MYVSLFILWGIRDEKKPGAVRALFESFRMISEYIIAWIALHTHFRETEAHPTENHKIIIILIFSHFYYKNLNFFNGKQKE